MKKTIIPLLLASFLGQSVFAIESNHSYIKNSEFANDFAVKINGVGEFYLYYFNEKNKNGIKRDKSNRKSMIVLNTEVSSNYNELFVYGFKFVGVADKRFGSTIAGEIFLDGTFGKFEFGSPCDVTEKMRVGADTIAVGTGGAGGDAIKYTSKIDLRDALVAPGTLMNQNFGFHDNKIRHKWGGKFTNKINYFSPEFLGFQFGLSIKPHAKISKSNLRAFAGTGHGVHDKVAKIGHFVSAALSYVNTFGDVGISSTVTYEENFLAKYKDKFRSFEVSAMFNYFGLSLAGSYGMNWRNVKHAYLTVLSPKNGFYFTYGGSYEMGSTCISATFFNSKTRGDRKVFSWDIGLKYNVTKNFSAYVEYIDYNFSGSANPTQNGRAFGAFTGLLVHF